MRISREELQRQAFPLLTGEQIDLLRPFGEERRINEGDILFEAGDAIYPMVVVLAGTTEIVDRSAEPDRVIRVGEPGAFHAELGLLTGQASLVACVVREPGRVLLVPADAVREVIVTIPDLSDLFVTAFAARREILLRSEAGALVLVGPQDAPAILELEEFAARNTIPFRSLTPQDPAAVELLAQVETTDESDVRVIVRGEQVLANPTISQIACAVGLDLAVDHYEMADLIVIGTGPAGLAAAVYAASEGLTTVAVEAAAIGGQAGTSSRIENYLGFPTGISGWELAFRAEVQAVKFGARITVPRRATKLIQDDGGYAIQLDDTTELRCRCVVIATGARYRRLGLPHESEFEGAGIYYAATELEARYCRDDDVVVVGGGNSAGQAAVFLAGSARRLHLVYRGPDLSHGMSQYLISRLERTPNVCIHTAMHIAELHGDERLESVTIASEDGQQEAIRTRAVFVMIGAEPRTEWLRDAIALDDHDFVITGKVSEDGRMPLSPYETSLPGVFAVGDVRRGSVKRVAAAVGEGSIVVQAVHAYLESIGVDEQEPITPASAA